MITLVLNSPDIDLNLLHELSQSSVLIGVDGGLNALINAGLVPQWAVGDFDSAEPDLLPQLPKTTRVLRAPVEKDYTDLELALRLVKMYRPHRLNVLGLGGGPRFDHQLVGSLALWQVARRGCQVQAWSGQQKFTFTQASQVLSSCNGEMFSVFAMTKPVTVSLWGAKYSGTGLRVLPGSGLGLGNEFVKGWVALGIHRGVAGICQW